MTGLAITSLLEKKLKAQAVDVAVIPTPVATPAGGLVRVVHVTPQSSAVLLDKSYTGGTGPCSLQRKFEWKLSPKDTRGPPPFKGPLPTPWSDKMAALNAARVVADDSQPPPPTALPCGRLSCSARRRQRCLRATRPRPLHRL